MTEKYQNSIDYSISNNCCDRKSNHKLHDQDARIEWFETNTVLEEPHITLENSFNNPQLHESQFVCSNQLQWNEYQMLCRCTPCMSKCRLSTFPSPIANSFVSAMSIIED